MISKRFVIDAACYFVLSLAVSTALAETVAETEPTGFVLSQEILDISYQAARLSNLTYHHENELLHYGERVEIGGAGAFMTRFVHPNYEEEYDYVHIYTQEPDQALVAKKADRCYLAFRGTVSTNVLDWFQNLDMRDRTVHRNNDTSLEGCEVRKGYVDFLDSLAVGRAFSDILACIESSSCDVDDVASSSSGPCLVITGHSQGGASATVASILTHRLNPVVVTFGQPPAVDGGCDSIPSERYYRYVNSIKDPYGVNELAFDPVPFVPTLLSQSVHYGRAVLLGEDNAAAKYLGMDGDADFEPSIFDRQDEVGAHAIGVDRTGSYGARIGALFANSPAPATGFTDGAFCDRDYHGLCSSGWCSRENKCASNIDELCVPDSCEDDVDCASGACVRDSCAAGKGMVGGGCPCWMNRDCASGECDMALTTLSWTCKFEDGEVLANTSGAVAVAVSLRFALAAAAVASIALFSV